MQVTDLIPSEYKILVETIMIAMLLVGIFACGWFINGWRLGKDVAKKDTEITRLNGEIEKQNTAYKLLAEEAIQRQKDAKVAQVEAALMRKRFNDRAKALSTKPASSCDEVLKRSWWQL